MTKPIPYTDDVYPIPYRQDVALKTGLGGMQFNVYTDHGIAECISSEIFVTAIRFVWDGELYERRFKKSLTNSGLTRKATQFANEVVSEAGQ